MVNQFWDYESCAECERLEKEIEKKDKRIAELEKLATQRGARMQIMREWLLNDWVTGFKYRTSWSNFIVDIPEASEWFDADGVPVREEK